MKFKSKVDWYIHFTFVSLIIATCVWWTMIFMPSPNIIDGICASILSALCLVILFMWFGMCYILYDNELIIKIYGVGTSKKISYSDIISVMESKNPTISATSLSLDRIELKFKLKKKNTNKILYISPRNKSEFLKLLSDKTI